MAASEPPESGSQAEASPSPLTDGSAEAFLAESRRYLTVEYPAKIDSAVRLLEIEDLWWRPTLGSNSVGHLVRHLSGNVRQWVVHGIGGHPDVRERAAEFGDDDQPPLETLMGDLRLALEDADRVLDRLTSASLTEPRDIQGLRTTVLLALYHVVEHFSMHTGQILWIVKARTGRDLGFYQVDDDGYVTGTTW